MTIKYETIKSIKPKKSFWSISDFKPEESNRIIKNLAEKIEQYGQIREMETKYNKKTLNNGEEKILRAEMKSKDGIIGGIIYHNPSRVGLFSGGMDHNGSIKAEFNFNSNDPLNKQEYTGLVKIIKAI